jgi:hypothetical protein
MAHKIADLGTLVLLFFGLASAVAHKEEQPNGYTSDSNNTNNNASGNASDIGTGSAIRLGAGRSIWSFGLLLA